MAVVLTSEEEAKLAIEAKTEEQAFSRLYEQYLPKIFAYVTRRINDRDEAEDIVSQIFLKVVEGRGSFNPEKSSFKTWLYSIATHCMIDYFRSSRRRTTEDIEAAETLSDPGDTPATAAQKSSNRDLVHTVITQLPHRHQKLLMLKYFSDLSIEEIAATLGVSHNNVSVMLHRALKAFQLTYNRYV